jgi:hypothetical protein
MARACSSMEEMRNAYKILGKEKYYQQYLDTLDKV